MFMLYLFYIFKSIIEQRSKGLETWLSKLATDVQIQRLALAGAFVENLRNEIFKTTSFKCSAGISFNKVRN
jgi:nucleotidyltransferase/DNA polymerase involved in DNA repair